MALTETELQALWEALAKQFGRDKAATIFDYVLTVPSTWREGIGGAPPSPGLLPEVRLQRLYARSIDVLGKEATETLMEYVHLPGRWRAWVNPETSAAG